MSNATTIRLGDRYGRVLTGRAAAETLRAELEGLLGDGVALTVDFAGVLAVSPSFADEVFAKLDPARVADGSVTFIGLRPGLASIARFVREARVEAVGAS